MKQRIITAAIGIALLIPVLIFSETWVYPIVIATLAAIAAFELLSCVGVFKKWLISIPAIALTAASPLTVRLFADKSTFVLVFAAALFAYLLLALACGVFAVGCYSFFDAAAALTTAVFLGGAFAAIVALRDINYGQYLYLLAFLAPWISDAFAYFGGSAFGKKKLIPAVSPKKTVAGSLVALFLTPLATVLFGVIVCSFIDKSLSPNYFVLALTGFLLSAVGQIGDLIASAIKRQYEIKDYGNLLPGHGGVLDRFDSILTTAPLLLLFSILPAAFQIFNGTGV